MKQKPVVLLLVGGESTRFWPLKEKNLTTMMGKPLLEWQLTKLAKLGFRDIIVIGNQKVVDWLAGSGLASKAGPCYGIKQDKNLLGMAGAILSAEKLYLQKYQGRALYVLIANDFYNDKLHKDILSAFNQKKGDVYIPAYQVKTYRPQGYLVLKGSQIMQIIEKPGAKKMPSNWANLGLYIYHNPKSLFKELKIEMKKKIATDDLYERAMSNLMKSENFQLVEYPRESVILKYPWHLLGVMDFFLNGIKKPKIAASAQISRQAVIKGPVIIEKNVRVFEGAVISGPAYIGSNTVVGNNALVRNSVIEADCEIGFCTEVARSYIGSQCRLHSNYVGDSVLTNKIDMGAGAVTANFRLDEQNIHSHVKGVKTDSQLGKLGTIIGQNSKVGVNASIMPGVKIGSKSVVGPGVVQYHDLPDNKKIILDQKISDKL